MPTRLKTARGLSKPNYARDFKNTTAKELQDLSNEFPLEASYVPPSLRYHQISNGSISLPDDFAFREEVATLTGDAQDVATATAIKNAKAALLIGIKGLQSNHAAAIKLWEETEMPDLGVDWQSDFEKLARLLELGHRVAAGRMERVLQQHEGTAMASEMDREKQKGAAELLGMDLDDTGSDMRKKDRDVLADTARGVVRMTKGLTWDQNAA